MAFHHNDPDMRSLANKVMEYLNGRSFPVMTRTIMEGVGIEDRPYNRKRMSFVLKHLTANDSIDKISGEKRSRWLIANREWDKTRPLKQDKPVESAYDRDVDAEDSDPNNDDDPSEDDTAAVPMPVSLDHTPVFDRIAALEEYKTQVQTTLERMQEEIDATGKREIVVKRYTNTIVKLKDKVLPKVFNRVKALAECRRNILLVGPAGCGKSHLAEMLALVMGLRFGSISLTAGMSESHLLGRAVPDLSHGKNKYQTSEFVDFYENGGVYLLDELDAADPNLMLAINTGLANRYLNVPNRTDQSRAERHEDFICVATANTFGRGATRIYAGRNQLDESTLDRFRIGIVECYYDAGVEAMVCPNIPLREWCQTTRGKIERAAGVRRIMSTRFMQDAQVMLDHGWTLKEIQDTFVEGWAAEEKAKVA